MPDYHKIDIDVSAHIKKYITYHQSKNPLTFAKENEVKLDKKSYIGIIILNFLQKQKTKPTQNPLVKYNNKKINSKITLSLLDRNKKGLPQLKHSFYCLNKKKVIDLDIILDALFRQELFLFLDAYTLIENKNRKIKEGLFLFYKKYNLHEEDLAVETILTDYRRYKRKCKSLGIRWL